MVRKGSGPDPMSLIIAVAVGLIVLVAVYSFAPQVGYKIGTASEIPDGSEWDTANMSASGVDGASIWTDNAGLPLLAVLAFCIALAIMFFRRMGGS
ncbi:hypothetical protein DSECCO2_436570 [anaerobic digester metagenome]